MKNSFSFDEIDLPEIYLTEPGDWLTTVLTWIFTPLWNDCESAS